MRVDDYLGIPEAYGRWLGGLHWSETGEVVEYSTDPEIGLTFAMGGELALLLQGLGADGDLLHFAHVLHFLRLLGYGGRAARPSGSSRLESHPALTHAYREAGRPLRNAGVLCDVLCADIPRVPDPPRQAELQRQLNEPSPMRFAILQTYPGEEPPLDPETFDARLRQALDRLSRDDLRHWLRHGRGPIPDTADNIARAMPETLAQALAELEGRPRLRGATALATRLAGALALPPRRLAHRELPVGGYTDVITRGQPEQILPAQFALDPDEFLRRFTTGELLYFHREEPRVPTARELVLVIDQGVRTWGDVRLGLVAAAVALARRAEKQGLAVRFATTDTAGELVDPLVLGADALGELLESSDLTPNPAAALERTLAILADDGAARDAVVLTHPRNLAEPAVAAAARGVGPASRLFAVAVDGSGAVTLAELRGGGTVPIGRCRIDLADAHAADAADAASRRARPSSAAPWLGDVEPIGFPFRLGALAPISDGLFDFDDAGEWLLVAGRHGLLHLHRTDDSAAEMLPRAVFEMAPLDEVDSVLGVAGGFVVAGTAGQQTVLAAYDLVHRMCVVTLIGVPPGLPLEWTYVRGLHSVVAIAHGRPRLAIDLGTRGLVARSAGEWPASPRATAAFGLAYRKQHALLAATPNLLSIESLRSVSLEADSGRLTVRDDTGEWSYQSISEGRPTLVEAKIERVRWGGATIATLLVHRDGRRTLSLFIASGSPVLIEEHLLARDARDFALSRDGRKVAWRVGDRQVVVREVGRRGPPALLTPKGKSHSEVEVELGAGFLTIQCGRHAHLVRWDRGRLEFARTEGEADWLVARVFDVLPPRLMARGGPIRLPSLVDRNRFRHFAVTPSLTAAVDRFGQVALLDHEKTLVCMFFAFREQIAAWAPDGTRLGPASLIGGPPTPGGEESIGAALAAAAAAARGSTP